MEKPPRQANQGIVLRDEERCKKCSFRDPFEAITQLRLRNATHTRISTFNFMIQNNKIVQPLAVPQLTCVF